jgi:hypothetical protein
VASEPSITTPDGYANAAATMQVLAALVELAAIKIRGKL